MPGKRTKTTRRWQPKKKTMVYPAVSPSTHHVNPRFVWTKLRGVVCRWPAQVISEEVGGAKMQIYIKSDNALLVVKSDDTLKFPGDFDVIEQQGLEILKHRTLEKTIKCYIGDIQWAQEMLLNCEKGSDTTTERGIGDGGDNDSYYIPESDSEGTGTTEQIVIPPVTGDEESHFIKERHNPSISDECNISDRNNDSDNISKSDSEGTGTTEQIVIPPATGDEESHCIKERLDPSISDECNISDRDNSDNIPESDSEGTRTTEQIVISPATGDEESHCIKERHDPSISDECNISDRDNDSDKIPESDLEGTRTTEKIVMPPATGDEESHFIKERHDPSISDECNISDRNNDSDNISESDSEGTGTTGQIVIPPATGDEESHCIKERLDPNISDECNISDRDNSDKIPESDLEGTRTTEQIVIPPATGDEESHCIKERHDPSISDECNISDRDNDSDKIPESDLEGTRTTEQIVIPPATGDEESHCIKERLDPSISDECNISDRDNDSDKIPESDSERTRTTEQIVMPPATGDEESHCIKESRDPRNSDECNISDSDNDSYNIPESDSKGTGTTEQIVIPPGTGDEESQFIKERHDPRNSDECNISDTDNDSDYILESDWEGSRTTEQIVIPPATGDEESHCIKESRDPRSPDECNISDSDNDSDYIPESDSEGTRTTEQIVIPQATGDEESHCIKEKHILRDINQPGIYIRKIRKSHKSSKAQAGLKKSKNTRVYNNYHACIHCGKMRQHIKTHLESHRNIPEIKRLLKEDKLDINTVRKMGDHKHNMKVIKDGIGEIILSRRPEGLLDVNRFGPCNICKEWFLLKNLKRHVTKCSPVKVKLSKRQLIIQSQVEAGFISKAPSKLMLNEVFPCMRMDDVAQIAKSDDCIIALAESWLRRSIDNREKRKYYTSQHMRLMAKLLIQVRNLDKDSSSATKGFADYMKTGYFDIIVAAALECCAPFMDDLEDLQSPSNGIKIKYDLQRMLTARWAMLVKADPRSKLAKEVLTCQELIRVEWADKIVKLSRTVLARRSFTLQKELPSPEDVKKLTLYITSELKNVTLSADNYSRIVKLVQTRLMLYNKRRSGELEVIRLESYAGKTSDIDEMDQSMVEDLTDVEKYLLKSQELMRVRGKGNRPVPVLIPADTQIPLDYIASRKSRREAGITDDNVYLFPNSVQSYARAYHSLKGLCDECLLGYPGRITSVSMRKYTATLTQMLNLNQYQLDWVCRHLGHSSDVHKAHYRQMSGLVERVYVTKMLLLQDMNLTKKFKGQDLNSIDLTEIVFPENIVDSSEETRGTLAETVAGVMEQSERDDEPVDRVVFEDYESNEEEDDVESDEEPPKPTNKTRGPRWP